MSKLGKILVWFNAFLAFAFLGFASALIYKSGEFKKKYDDEVTAHKKTQDEESKKFSDLNAKFTTLQRELASAQSANGSLAQEKDSLESALGQEKTANAQFRGSLDQISANLDNYRAANQSLSEQIAKLQKENTEVRDARDAATAAQLKAEMERSEALAMMQKAKAGLEELQADAEKAIKDRDSLVAKLQAITSLTGVAMDVVSAQPQIDGTVVEVAADNSGLIAINAGKAQGVQMGFSFDIYSGTQYKGKAIVNSVQENYCSAVIKMRNASATIQVGDKATTKLN